MREPVSDPAYWLDRMHGAFASGERHRLMFNGSIEQFSDIENRQKRALRVIKPGQSVIDVGCGYGRLLDLLRIQEWKGQYVGYDVSPDLVSVARKWWPDYEFHVANLASDSPDPPFRANWAVSIWVKTMLMGNGLGVEWDRIEEWMRRSADEVLIVD